MSKDLKDLVHIIFLIIPGLAIVHWTIERGFSYLSSLVLSMGFVITLELFWYVLDEYIKYWHLRRYAKWLEETERINLNGKNKDHLEK